MLRGSIPPTDIPLPLVSAGGIILVVLMSEIGIVLAVDRQSSQKIINKKSKLN